MSITDELQKYADDIDSHREANTLIAIADRIDEAHERALNDCVHDPAIAADYWEAIIAERYIELPKDKNGKTVLIGDMVKSQEHRGRIREVIGIRLSEKVNVWSLEFHVSEGGSEFAPANRCELVERDTQEKIDADVSVTTCVYFGNEGKLCECCRNYSEERHNCDTDKIQDLLRRQRDLGGAK